MGQCMPLISCVDLTLAYDKKIVVSNLSFEVGAGDYLCIVGENGTGKSTLMKTMLGLIQPVSGQVEIGGGLAQGEAGYLPQQTAVQKDFPATVQEVVRSGFLNRVGMRPFYSGDEKNAAGENMKKLGIAHLAKSCYRELSGGQQQRALLARALCATRKILFMDEPAAGLDPNAASDMYELIYKLNAEHITIIMITHNITAAVRYASHILHIGVGSVLFFGTKNDYMQSEAGLAYAYTGSDHAL